MKPDPASSESAPSADRVNAAVDLLVVFYNNGRIIDTFLASLKSISIPFNAYFLDNASRDDTFEMLNARRGSGNELPFPARVTRSDRNLGFAGGVNLLARQGNAEYLFLLNPDTEIEPYCLERLLERAASERRMGICDARQTPREHPKAWDATTGETTWCSGAAALIRRQAFEEVGGFDDRLYFMYCEDVDLSWRLWLRGWKCLYVPSAVVRHWTQDLTPGKRRTHENYFSFRNSLFLYYRFGRPEDKKLIRTFFRKRFITGGYSLRSRVLFAIALMDYIRYIPFLLRGRNRLGGRHPWVRLQETSLSQ